MQKIIMLLSCYHEKYLWGPLGEGHHGRQRGTVLRVTCLLCFAVGMSVNHISNSGHPQDALSLGKVSTAVSCPFPPRYKQF